MLIAVFGASACVYRNLSDTCNYASEPYFYQFEPDALTFVVGSPPRPNSEIPFLVFDAPDGDPELTVQLVTLDDSYELPHEIENHRCKNVEIRAFGLLADSEDWDSYWAAAKERGEFAVGVAFPDLDTPVRSRSIGFAFVDDSTRSSAASCGCLAE